MKTLKYAPAPHHVLVEDGREIHGGETFTVSDERAEQLLANPHVPVEKVAHELRRLTRAQLEELAAEAGIEQPDSFRNKDELIAALDQQS